MSEPFVYKYSVDGLASSEHEQQIKNVLGKLAGVEQVDINREKHVLRIISSRELSSKDVSETLLPHGFQIHSAQQPFVSPTEQQNMVVGIDGMTCRSCEVLIERSWKKIPGMKKIRVDAATGKAEIWVNGNAPTIAELQEALGDNKYLIHDPSKKSKAGVVLPTKRPTFIQLVGLFALVFIVGNIFLRLGLFKSGFTVSSGMGFGAIFLVGLVAASSSCIAVVGGLLLSSAAKFNERYGSMRPIARMRPVVLFVLGRIAGYTLLGGLLGVVGGIFTLSPLFTALITIAAALYMLVMGLEMLHIAPVWLKKFMPRMPKSLSHRIMNAEGKEHPMTPFLLGVATFFLPCGFTQALQLYALTTGSFTASSLMMLAFALGTAPALLALGYASSSLKGKAGQFFFRFSGALVIVLGLWNIQNGLTIAGYPINFPSFSISSATLAAGSDQPSRNTGVTVEGNVQVVKMRVGYSGYEPDQFTITAGMPVRWEIDGTNAGGCIGVLVSRQIGVQKLLEPGINVIEFTPKVAGKIAFACSMGMFRGNFTVLPQA